MADTITKSNENCETRLGNELRQILLKWKTIKYLRY